MQHAEQRAAKEACMALLERLLHQPQFKDVFTRLQSIHVDQGCIVAKLVLKPGAQFKMNELELLQQMSQRWLAEIQASEAQMQLPDGRFLRSLSDGEYTPSERVQAPNLAGLTSPGRLNLDSLKTAVQEVSLFAGAAAAVPQLQSTSMQLAEVDITGEICQLHCLCTDEMQAD